MIAIAEPQDTDQQVATEAARWHLQA